jgi:hypothetical protein
MSLWKAIWTVWNNRNDNVCFCGNYLWVSLDIERIIDDFYILLSFLYDILDPIFPNIAIHSLRFVNIHLLHPSNDRLIILLVLLLCLTLPLSSSATLAFAFLLREWQIDGSLCIFQLPLFAVVPWVRILIFRAKLLRVIPIEGVHHNLEQFSLLRVLLFFENELAENHKTFLHLDMLTDFCR